MSNSTPDALSPYQVIADRIRDDISAGRLRPGDKIPSVPKLAESFGVATATVQSAIKLLKADHLVEGRSGSGTYVLDRRVRGWNARAAFMNHLHDGDPRPAWVSIPDPEEAASFFGSLNLDAEGVPDMTVRLLTQADPESDAVKWMTQPGAVPCLKIEASEVIKPALTLIRFPNGDVLLPFLNGVDGLSNDEDCIYAVPRSFVKDSLLEWLQWIWNNGELGPA